MTSRRKSTFAAAFAAILVSATGLAWAQEHGETAPTVGHDNHGETAPAAGHGDVHGEHGGTPAAVRAGEGGNVHGEGTPGTAAGEHAEHGGGEGHGGEHGSAHGGGHHGPEAINWTDISNKQKPAFIALVVNFGLLVGLYYTLGKKPVSEGLKQRRINIGKDIEEAQKLLAEAQERAKKYQADLKNADADAETARAALVSAGKGEADRLVKEASEKAERMRRDAERLVDQERKQVQQDLLVETIDLAVQEAGRLLEKSVSADDHARLAQDLLSELAKKPSAPRAGTTGGLS